MVKKEFVEYVQIKFGPFITFSIYIQMTHSLVHWNLFHLPTNIYLNLTNLIIRTILNVKINNFGCPYLSHSILSQH